MIGVSGSCGIGKMSDLAFHDALRIKYRHDRATYSESKSSVVQKVLTQSRSRGLGSE